MLLHHMHLLHLSLSHFSVLSDSTQMAVAVSSDNQHWLLCIGRIFYPIFLLVSSAVTYLAGLWIERNRKQEKTYIRENAGQFASRQEKKEFKKKEKNVEEILWCQHF